MTLESAIKHAEEVAKEQEKAAKEWHENQVRKCELIRFTEMDYTHENNCKKCAEEHRQLAEWLKELKAYKEQEPCEDAVSRQAVLYALDKRFDSIPMEQTTEILLLRKDLRELPSVTLQEPKTGWIPVSERLPKRNGYYLVTGRQGAVNKRLYQDGHWYGNWAILAWMPLPSPYELQESEEV